MIDSLNIPLEHLYEYSLYVTIVLAGILPYLDPAKRSVVATIGGFVTIALFCGKQFWMHTVLIIGCFIISRASFLGTARGSTTFVFSFSWCTLLRLSYFVPTWLQATEATDMMVVMVTLRVICYAYHISDGTLPPSANGGYCIRSYIEYVYFFPGIWSGPFLNFSTVINCLRSERTYEVRVFRFFIGRFVSTFIHIATWVLLPLVFDCSTEMLLSPQFNEYNFLKRYAIAELSMCNKRGKYMCCWLLAEVSCVAAGVGHEEWRSATGSCSADDVRRLSKSDETPKGKLAAAVPQTQSSSSSWLWEIGTTKWNSECLVDDTQFTAYNSMKIESASTMQEVIRCWNCSVQRWMVEYVYKRLPRQMPKNLKRVLVVIISAAWHGILPSYYVTFILLPTFQITQDHLYTLLEPGFNKMPPFVTRSIQFIITNVFLNFTGIPFAFMNMRQANQLWGALWYSGFVLAGIGLVSALIVTKKEKKP